MAWTAGEGGGSLDANWVTVSRNMLYENGNIITILEVKVAKSLFFRPATIRWMTLLAWFIVHVDKRPYASSEILLHFSRNIGILSALSCFSPPYNCCIANSVWFGEFESVHIICRSSL